jgi:hypothetical protein
MAEKKRNSYKVMVGETERKRLLEDTLAEI